MNIPFVLKFIHKIELFQTLRKLDKQFNFQIEEIDNKDDASVSLWEAEKKILFWTYKKHRHLGSPLRVDSFKSKKSVLLRLMRRDTDKIKEINKRDSDDMEKDIQKTLGEIFKQKIDIKNNFYYGKLKNIGDGIYEFGFSAKELERISIRKVFGNLVSRGYANFYPEVQKEFSHWEKETESMSRGVYENVPTTQNNCDGILITQDGMLMGELLNDLFKMSEIHLNSNVLRIYKKNTNAERYLSKKFLHWITYWFFITIGWLAFFEIALFIIGEFLKTLNIVCTFFR